jgi:hypothetical protein
MGSMNETSCHRNLAEYLEQQQREVKQCPISKSSRMLCSVAVNLDLEKIASNPDCQACINFRIAFEQHQEDVM